ncbi:Hsp70 family protein [Clostridium hydrogenum]|uniref:Hsp70 family protein n=1 Tax=Clostridium hydrogenum TaxID=2855764 RepID=UPI001F2BFAB9|nr:Hsp70 family protein [Clostridium hydrogenum]
MKYSLGIDLGTTFSVMSVIDEKGVPKVLKNSEGKTLTPSVIYFDEADIVVGDEAKEQQAMGDLNVAAFFKRNIGDEYFSLNFGEKYYSAEDLSTIMLKKLKKDAETELNTEIKDAVITVPAYFNNSQREATINAGKAAGFNVLSIINEPTAAAIAYGIKKDDEEKNLLVYDLGGGTFDVTLVHIDKESIKVLGTDGDHELGGKDWDDRIAVYLGEKFAEKFGINPLEDIEFYNDILVKAENAKKQLSAREKAEVTICCNEFKGKFEITRKIFESITGDLLERTRRLSEDVLQGAGISFADLSGVLPVGGSTRMPMVLNFVKEVSGKEVITGINVDEAVSIGAAIEASSQAKDQGKPVFTLGSYKKTEDVMSHSLGMAAISKDGTKYINSIIIPKNKKIPCTEKRPYAIRTGRNRDNSLDVYMLQGESEDISNSSILGKYTFYDITHVRGKQAVIDIEYAYNKNGVVTVAAAERETGKVLPLRIEKCEENLSWLYETPKEEEETIHRNIILAIDLSGSMRGKPLEQAINAARNFISEIDIKNSSVGLVAFADKVESVCELKDNASEILEAIDNLKQVKVGTSTTSEPFTKAQEMFKNADGDCFILVLTDGQWYGKTDVIGIAEECKKEGIEISAIGLGSAKKEFLDKIASCRENAILTEAINLKQSFSKIARVISESYGSLKMFQGYGQKSDALQILK